MRTRTRLTILVSLLLGVGVSLAGFGTLYLKNGAVLRGEIVELPDAVVLRNAAGETRYERTDVDRIEYVAPASHPTTTAPIDDPNADHGASQPASAESQPVSQAAGSRPAEPATSPVTQPVSRPASQPASSRFKGVEPPPLLSQRDIRRLKLYELPVDGDAEKVNVNFLRSKGELALDEQVRRDLERDPQAEPDWERTLRRGTPAEKLQVILRATGMKHADRIDVKSDPRVFADYRRNVLPLVLKGCVRSGCHGGNEAHVFRFPTGAQATEEFAYTSFLILDRGMTRLGPLINRAAPEESVLLKYMLPAKRGEPGHPPTTSGRLTPVIETTRSREYTHVLEWISSLRQQSAYELNYSGPGWLEDFSRTLVAPASAPGRAPSTSPASAATP